MQISMAIQESCLLIRFVCVNWDDKRSIVFFYLPFAIILAELIKQQLNINVLKEEGRITSIYFCTYLAIWLFQKIIFILTYTVTTRFQPKLSIDVLIGNGKNEGNYQLKKIEQICDTKNWKDWFDFKCHKPRKNFGQSTGLLIYKKIEKFMKTSQTKDSLGNFTCFLHN